MHENQALPLKQPSKLLLAKVDLAPWSHPPPVLSRVSLLAPLLGSVSTRSPDRLPPGANTSDWGRVGLAGAGLWPVGTSRAGWRLRCRPSPGSAC